MPDNENYCICNYCIVSVTMKTIASKYHVMNFTLNCSNGSVFSMRGRLQD